MSHLNRLSSTYELLKSLKNKKQTVLIDTLLGVAMSDIRIVHRELWIEKNSDERVIQVEDMALENDMGLGEYLLSDDKFGEIG